MFSVLTRLNWKTRLHKEKERPEVGFCSMAEVIRDGKEKSDKYENKIAE